MAIIKQFPKKSKLAKAKSNPNRFPQAKSNPNTFTKAEFNLNTKVNLLLGSLTFTAVASFAIVQLAPSDYAARNQNQIKTINQIQGSESATEESQFKKQQLDDINSITNNTMMMMDDHYNY